MPDRHKSPDQNRLPYALMSDEALRQAYKRVATDPDNSEVAHMLRELLRRGPTEDAG